MLSLDGGPGCHIHIVLITSKLKETVFLMDTDNDENCVKTFLQYHTNFICKTKKLICIIYALSKQSVPFSLEKERIKERKRKTPEQNQRTPRAYSLVFQVISFWQASLF